MRPSTLILQPGWQLRLCVSISLVVEETPMGLAQKQVIAGLLKRLIFLVTVQSSQQKILTQKKVYALEILAPSRPWIP